jgi:hypothetical protein
MKTFVHKMKVTICGKKQLQLSKNCQQCRLTRRNQPHDATLLPLQPGIFGVRIEKGRAALLIVG